MPVGGIREKVIAAHRAGIERIVLSSKNRRDLREVPEEVKAQVKFEFVDTISQVLKIALDLDMETGQPARWQPPASSTPAVA
jgi:ATP-dependent Lon protease